MVRESAVNGTGNGAVGTIVDTDMDMGTGMLSPYERGEAVDDDELIALQGQTRLRAALPERIMAKLPEHVRKQLIDTTQFEEACVAAAEDHNEAAERMEKLAQGDLDTMVEFATICIDGPVGKVGKRRALRATACQLLDTVLAKDPDHTAALCVKGEMLMPRSHYGKADPETPAYILVEAYKLFVKAADLGSIDGKFLKGRWLVTMAGSHKNEDKGEEGKRLIEDAAANGLAKANVFLGQCYEFPGRFGKVKFNLPENIKKDVILKYYMRAAEFGDPDALNDVGSSYATGYGSLEKNFDETIKYYVKAIRAGSLHAFDNLGTHYETGMSGDAIDRIDYKKAMYYYRAGARMRCSKCVLNLACAYEEGMQGVVERDTKEAENYYRYAILIADDDNDAANASRALKELIALYITRLKSNQPASECVQITEKKIYKWLNKRMANGTLNEVNKKIAQSIREARPNKLAELVGDTNAQRIFGKAESLVEEYKKDTKDGQDPTPSLEIRMKHIFGNYVDDVVKFLQKPPAKRRRTLE